MGEKHATRDVRLQIHTLSDAGFAPIEISKRLSIAVTKVYRLRRLPVTPKPRSGRPKKKKPVTTITSPIPCRIVDFLNTNTGAPARRMPEREVSQPRALTLSDDTIRRALASVGCHPRLHARPQAELAEVRLADANEHEQEQGQWTKDDSATVLFTTSPRPDLNPIENVWREVWRSVWDVDGNSPRC
ncbi:MAG: hypothetical protein M1826_007309 [Phylliscum demangeonii]|nr:MAG: hypothetical protein M1826_007309 [Phylliscum demangeonii]